MKTVCLANMKGGTGKTSIATTLAASLARHNSTVLFDFDPQANATGWAAPDNADLTSELAQVLQGSAGLRQAVIQTDTAGLSLLPTFGIGGGLKAYIENTGELRINKAVKDLLTDAEAQGYVYCIIDLSPAFGKIERAAVIASDELITPILCDRFCIDGLESITAHLLDLQNLVGKPIARYKRLIINGFDRRIKRHAEIADTIKQQSKQTVYTLPIDQVFFRGQAASQMIWEIDPKPETRAELERLTDDLIGGAS